MCHQHHLIDNTGSSFVSPHARGNTQNTATSVLALGVHAVFALYICISISIKRRACGLGCPIQAKCGGVCAEIISDQALCMFANKRTHTLTLSMVPTTSAASDGIELLWLQILCCVSVRLSMRSIVRRHRRWPPDGRAQRFASCRISGRSVRDIAATSFACRRLSRCVLQ